MTTSFARLLSTTASNHSLLRTGSQHLTRSVSNSVTRLLFSSSTQHHNDNTVKDQTHTPKPEPLHDNNTQSQKEQEEVDDDIDLNKETGEVGGPKGPEPTRSLPTKPLIYPRQPCPVCKVVKNVELCDSTILRRQNELARLQFRFCRDSVENVSSWLSQNMESGKMSGIARLRMSKIPFRKKKCDSSYGPNLRDEQEKTIYVFFSILYMLQHLKTRYKTSQSIKKPPSLATPTNDLQTGPLPYLSVFSELQTERLC